MSGEKSKKTGEYGENVVAKVLERIGWGTPHHGINIPCVHPQQHKLKERDRKVHGLDFLVYLEDKLVDGGQNTVVVSSKYNKTYPTNPTTLFRGFLKDISQDIECLSDNDEYGGVTLHHDIEDTQYPGVIFWIAHDEGKDDQIISEVEEFRHSDENYSSIYLVDNRRANFILDTLNFVRLSYPDPAIKIEFVYPSTGRNLIPGKSTSGPQLPLQFINSSVIPIKVIKGQEEVLVLSLIDDYDPESFKHVLGMAQNLTQGWGAKVVICYRKYHDLTDGDSTQRCLRELSNESFTSKVLVKCYRPDHTSLEGKDLDR